MNASDVPIDGLSREDVAKFNDGDALFGLPFRPADGLGPLYIRTACTACHAEGSRGPGVVQKMVIVEPDGITPAADQNALAYGHTVRPGMAAGATTPIAPPATPYLKLSVRVGPPVLGRGYIEAVDEAELVRLEAAQATRSDGIHGTIGRAPFASVPNPDPRFGIFKQGDIVVGRLGLKSRIATLDDFTADAFQGDMGLTTPMRPTELINPDGLLDDRRTGIDVAFSTTFAPFRTWTSFHSDGPPDDGTFTPDVLGPRTQYINKLPPAGSHEFPVGTVIVEARENADMKIFAGVKRGGGFNTGGAGNWEWFELQDAPVIIVWRGVGPPAGEMYGGDPNGGCNACHMQCGAGNDYVCSPKLSLAAF